MLKRARASPGMRLTVVLPTSTDVNSRCDGEKCSLPSSSGACKAAIKLKSWNRIIGTLRVCNMALAAGDDQGAVERTAASDLDRVANDFEIARFAENAMIEALAAVTRPLEKLDRAVDRNALLIAGDEERDRAFRFAAVRFQIVKRGGDKAGNAALHVDRAAAIQALLGNHLGKWRMRPRAFVTRRDDVGVPRE